MFFVCAQRMLYGLPLTHQNMTTWVPKSAYNCNQIKNKTLYTQTQTNANTSVEREERMCWNWMVWLRLSWWREKNQCFIHCTLNTNDYRWWKVVRSIRILREWIVSFALIKDVSVSACVCFGCVQINIDRIGFFSSLFLSVLLISIEWNLAAYSIFWSRLI